MEIEVSARYHWPRRTQKFQRGSALVIGLILLSVLTVLAASTMSTATLQLAMSGNDQFRTRALDAAELGIERAIATRAFEAVSRTAEVRSAVAGGDSYHVVVRARGLTDAPAHYRRVFAAEHFELESTGTSTAGASVTVIQGLFVVRTAGLAPSEPPPLESAPPTAVSQTVDSAAAASTPSESPAQESSTSQIPSPTACLTGVEILIGLCVEPGTPVRTYWRYAASS